MSDEQGGEQLARATGKTGGRVLIVDDDDQLRWAAARILSAAGYRVADTSSPSDALAILDGGACDLLLSDIEMREQSGPALVTQARAAHPDLRVLYMSGQPDAPAVDAHPLAAAEVIPKPFTPEQLIGHVNQTLNGPTGAPRPRT